MACLSRRWAERGRGVCRRTTAIHRQSCARGRASMVSRCLPVSPFGDICPGVGRRSNITAQWENGFVQKLSLPRWIVNLSVAVV
uniref:Uncharacterized protein n=1 Tax=Oryza glumipatula TaxID=40148 RepID=A0A0D9YA70_9ORYZ